jgi:ATP adenylyltransferase
LAKGNAAEQLWTPWRMPYIVSDKDTGSCIFCRMLKGSQDHRHILHRGATTFTILNLYPYTVGHLMIIPYRHLGHFHILTPEERQEIALGLRRAENILRREAGAEWFHAGINLGRAAGAGVDGHLHVHLVPRATPASWSGESTLSERLPVAMDETYRRLLPHFAALP